MAGFYLIDASVANFEAPTPLILAYYSCFCLAIWYLFLKLNEIRNYLREFVSICNSLFFFQIANIISNVYITCFMQPYIFFPLIGGRSVGLLSTHFQISFHTLASFLLFFLTSQLTSIVLGFLRLRRWLSCYACIRKYWARSTYIFLDVLFFVLPLTLSVSYYIDSIGKNDQMEIIQKNYEQFEIVLKNKTEFDIYQFESQHELFCIASVLTLLLTTFAIVFLNIEINSFLTMSRGLITDSSWRMHRNAFHLFQIFSLFLPFCIGVVFFCTYVQAMEYPAGRWLVQIPFLFFAVYPVLCSLVLLLFLYYIKLSRTKRPLKTAGVRTEMLDGRGKMFVILP